MTTATKLPWEKVEDGMRAAWVEHELYVSFENGSTYRFEGVPQKCHTDLLKAASGRRYFRAHIMQRFNFERLEAAP